MCFYEINHSQKESKFKRDVELVNNGRLLHVKGTLQELSSLVLPKTLGIWEGFEATSLISAA